MRVSILTLAVISMNNAPDDKVEPPQPAVVAPTVKEADQYNVVSVKPIKNQSSVTSIKEAINAKADFGTLPPITETKGSDRYILPKVDIAGCEAAIPLGDIVELSIKPIEKLPDGLKSSIYSWTILPPPPRVIPWVDSTKILFGTGMVDREYTVILTATYAFLTGSDIEHRTDTIIRTVTVGSGLIQPQKAMNLPKNEGYNELAQKIAASLGMVAPYDLEQRKTDLHALAESFRKVAAIAEAKPEITVRTIMTAQAEANAEALKANAQLYTNWYAFLGKLFENVKPDQTVGQTDVVKIYRTIASAIDPY